ncbi:MAG: hypothetical protein H6838_06225 [Planctomycetes bacterium]|nr:hypothetical protein [Planctomycetota bacterium]
MKHILWTASVIALASPIARAQWFEDFDSYATSTQVVGQGAWEEWGPGAGAMVTSAQARTPGNAIDINGPSDLVHQYSGYTSGTWVYRAHQYIPTGATGSTYFIMLNDYASPAGPYSWSMQLLFNTTTGMASQRCGGAATISMPFVLDQWVEIKAVVNLDEDWVQLYYNGVLFDDPAVADHPTLGGGYTWSLGDGGTNTTGLVNIAAVDLFANNASSVYYDDISLTRPESWHEDFDAYAATSQVVGQGGWDEWGPGAGALVSSAQSRSSANSIEVVGATDLVHEYSGYTSGTWVYRAHQYIPTGATGSTYFILLNDYASPAGPYSWSAQLQFNNTTGMVSQRCGGAATISMPFVYDQWAEIKVFLHLNQDWVQIYYNGVLFDDPAVADHPTLGGGYQWSLGDGGTNTTGRVNLGAIDLFANNASAVYYDDISLTPFEFETIGNGCAGSLPTSTITATSAPRVGQTFAAEIDNLPLSLAFLSLGFSTVSNGSTALPYDLGAVGMPNCWLRVSPDIVLFLTGTAGTANYSVAIPNDPAFEGVSFHAQALIPDPAAGNPLGGVASDAATILIGH